MRRIVPRVHELTADKLGKVREKSFDRMMYNLYKGRKQDDYRGNQTQYT